jgi:hypothetical protein
VPEDVIHELDSESGTCGNGEPIVDEAERLRKEAADEREVGD